MARTRFIPGRTSRVRIFRSHGRRWFDFGFEISDCGTKAADRTRIRDSEFAIRNETRQMGNPTATLERETLSARNAQAPQVDDSERPRAELPRAAIKFTYASGARPLEGYTIKRGVGRGGFGEVYFATSDAGKEVALKLIRRNLDVELRGVTQCLNLKHPNLIALYDI